MKRIKKNKSFRFSILPFIFISIFLNLVLGYLNYYRQEIINVDTQNYSINDEGKVESDNTKEFWVNDSSWFVKSEKYANTIHPFNVYTYNENDNHMVMNFNKVEGTNDDKKKAGVVWFNDDGNLSNSNEMEYSPIAKILFAPNIVSVDIESIYFEIKDYYRFVTWGGTDQSKVDGIDKVTLTNASTFDEDGISDSTNQVSYNDLIYIDEFGNDTSSNENFPFRFTYDDNPVGTSDVITIYEKNPALLKNDSNNAYGGAGWIDEGYLGREGNWDAFLDNSLKLTLDIVYDTPKFSSFSFDKSLFVKDMMSTIKTNSETNYFKSDGSDSDIVSDFGDYDKVNYSLNDVSYEVLIKNAFLGSITLGNFVSRYVRYTLDNNYSQSELNSKDLVLNYGYLKKDDNGNDVFQRSVILDDILTMQNPKNDNDGDSENTEDDILTLEKLISNEDVIQIDSSQVKMNLSINEESFFDIYSEVPAYEAGGYGYGINNNNSIDICFNLPFYNWTFEEISKDNDHLTLLDEPTNFLISDIELDNKLFQEEYTINVYTNSNIKFTVSDDSNISSISHEGTNINHDENNTFVVETNFEEDGDNALKQQSETITISYKNKSSTLEYDDMVNQKVNIKFNYDADSPIGNNEAIFEENLGANSKEIYSEVAMVTQNENTLLEESNDYELIDWFRAENDFTVTLDNSQMDFIANLDNEDGYDLLDENQSSEYVQNIDKVSLDSSNNYSMVFTNYQNLIQGNQVIFSEPGLYRWKVRTKAKSEYTYWILISDSFIDFEDSGEILSSETFPVEWTELKENGIINYSTDTDSYYLEIDGSLLYFKSFLDTYTGEMLFNKAQKKGWTRSELSKESSYSVKKLDQEWETLKDFRNLSIDSQQVSYTTSNLYEKEKNRYRDIEELIIGNIESQLINNNGLSYSDFEIYIYDENGEIMPDNKIIKNNDVINVEIKSSKRGSGINSYEFKFKTSMIEPIPLWIQTSIVLIMLAIIFSITLVIISMLNRRKIKRIKE